MRTSKPKKRIILAVIILFSAGIYFFSAYGRDSTENSANSTNYTQIPEKKGVLKFFTGEEFSKLYDSVAYPNTAYINEDTPITGDEDADLRIKELAEVRGYKLRSAPIANNLIFVGQGVSLQNRAAKSWNDLRAEAEKNEIKLKLTEGYRSAEDQKKIFLSRLGKVSFSSVAAGEADTRIEEILKTTALPGYSRHHTGYTVDIACENEPNKLFDKSICFRWLSANNYKNTKKHGWIPSYPEKTANQGPDPEAWEYVWVGLDRLTE